MTNPNPTFDCDDLYVSSYLATRTRLLATRQNGNRTHFIFSDTDGRASQAALDFINDPTVSLRAYLAAYKELRSVAFTARQSQKESR